MRSGPYATGWRWWLLCALLFGTEVYLYGGDNTASDTQVACRFIAYLGSTGRAYSTVKNYCAGVRDAFITAGLTNTFEHPRVRRCLKAYRRARGDRAKPKVAITAPLLSRFRSYFDLNNIIDLAVWAAMVLAFNCLLRGGEVSVKNGKNLVGRQRPVALRH